MAKEADNPFEEGKPAAQDGPNLRVKVAMRLGLMAVVLAVGSVGGYTAAGMFHRSAPADPNQAAPQSEAFEEPLPPQHDVAGEEYEYIDFEPITVNLNEPRLARYIRAAIILAVRKRDAATAREHIERKKMELRNWLTMYLAGRTLEDVRGVKSLNRIQREIQEACNEQLWPRRRPLIDHVLFKEFAVQ